MRLGGKYDTDRKAQIYLEFGDESLLGLGVKAMFVGRFGNRDGKLGFKLRDDRIFTTYLTFDLQGYYTWQINPIKIQTAALAATGKNDEVLVFRWDNNSKGWDNLLLNYAMKT